LYFFEISSSSQNSSQAIKFDGFLKSADIEKTIFAFSKPVKNSSMMKKYNNRFH
jgi:hypothetical protein